MDITSLTQDEKKHIIKALANSLNPRRRERIEQVLLRRTRYLTLILENIYQPHNAAAVLRSTECFGLQDLHVIERENTFKGTESTVSKGASKWLTVHRWQDTSSCLCFLKSQGYKLVATTPNPQAQALESFKVTKPIALMIGHEKGLSDTALNHADICLHIPMAGFTESFNLSVTVALFLHSLTGQIRRSNLPWKLSQEALLDLHLDWLLKSVKRADYLLSKTLH